MYQVQCKDIQKRKESNIEIYGNAYNSIGEIDLITQFLKSADTAHGYMFFENIDKPGISKDVVYFSRLSTRRHWKGWKKFGSIPITFKNYLETKGISTLVDGEAKRHTLNSLYKCLETNVYKSKNAADFATKILDQLAYEL